MYCISSFFRMVSYCICFCIRKNSTFFILVTTSIFNLQNTVMELRNKHYNGSTIPKNDEKNPRQNVHDENVHDPCKNLHHIPTKVSFGRVHVFSSVVNVIEMLYQFTMTHHTLYMHARLISCAYNVHKLLVRDPPLIL